MTSNKRLFTDWFNNNTIKRKMEEIKVYKTIYFQFFS